VREIVEKMEGAEEWREKQTINTWEPRVLLNQGRKEMEGTEAGRNLIERAKQEINETEETKAEALERLQKLLDEETSLHLPRDNPDYLIRFLRVAKFDVRKAFDRVVNHFKGRVDLKEDYAIVRPSNILPLLNEFIFTALPQPDDKGRRILFIKLSLWNLDKYNLNDIFHLGLLSFEKMSDEGGGQLHGISIVVDTSGCGFRVIGHLNLKHLRKCAKTVDGRIPIRVKGIHIVYAPSVFAVGFRMMRALFSKKMKERYFLHFGVKTLHEIIHPKYLPTEVGGELDSIDSAAYVNELLEWEPTFDKYCSFGYKE